MAASESETVGFIDVGTNSIHLLVVRFYKDSAGTPVFQDKETVRLGQSLYSTGRIDEETIRKSALVVSRFTQISKDLGADKVVAFATCAAREAANRDELIQALSSNAEVEVKVIPGTEEARLIALGVFGDKGPAERTIEIDIGGGSTEVIIREGGENLFLDSLSMGAVRYAYGLKINNKAPVSEDDYNFMMRNVDISSYHAVNRIKDIGFTKAMGSSGTLIALAEMCAARRGDHDSSYLTLRELRELMPEVRSRDMVGRYTIPGLGKGRADIIVAGGAIAEELMSQFGIERMDISQKGLKQGMQLDHMLTHGYTIFGIRESSIRALAHRCQYDETHAETVGRNAVSLFDQARGLGLNLMSDGYRNLLYCAALLHDIGEMISYTNHNVLSQVIIENADLVGFSIDEIRAMGLMVRFHHKKFPGSKDPRLSCLSREDALAVRQCAMFLKIADVADRHRNHAVSDIRLVKRGNTVLVELVSDADTSMELWSLEKVRPDFRKLFGLDMLPVRSADIATESDGSTKTL